MFLQCFAAGVTIFERIDCNSSHQEWYSMSLQDLVTVTIPAALLPAVTRLMQEHFEGATRTPVRNATTMEAVINGLVWTRPEVHAVHSRHRSQRARQQMRLIAERSLDGLTTSYGQLMQHVGVDNHGLRTDLAWLARRATAVKQEKAFPLIVTDAGAKADPGSRYNYRMPRRVAAWWLEADAAEASA